MYAGDSFELNTFLLANVCNVCLSANRSTFPLGEYREFYDKLLSFSKTLTADPKLCWECLALLKKLKQFETKCYIAQKILHSTPKHDKQKSLSTLTIAPTKVFDVSSNEEVSNDNTKGDIKSEFNEEEYDIGYDASSDISEHKTSDIKDFDYAEDRKVEKCKDEKIEIEAIVIDNAPTEINICKLKEDPGATLNVKNKYRFSKKDLEGHFRILQKTLNAVKYEKVPIKPDELQAVMDEELKSDFFKNMLHKCYDCVQCFQSLMLLNKHKKRAHDQSNGRYICEVCKSRLPTTSALKAHIRTHYYAHACSHCGFRCYSRVRVKRHIKHHTECIECAHCQLQFATMKLFSKHYKAQHSVFICDHCGKKCKTKYSLERHMKHHTDRNICLICAREYKTRSALRSHCELKHTESARELCYCVQCDKQFRNAALYRQHLLASKAHAPERVNRRNNAVRCPLCDKVYSRRSYMMNHYRHFHMKQSKYYCEECDKHFLNRTRYVEHKKYLHEGETKVKNKMCNICGKAFAANRTLTNHMRTHSGERPYACAQCAASFTQKHCLVAHVKHVHLKLKRCGLS